MLRCTMTNANMWMLFVIFTIWSVVQIHSAEGCNINSATSPAASSLTVAWDTFTNAVLYRLELRVINSTTIAPVIVTHITTTQKTVQGLKSGHNYEITLKALNFWSVEMSSCQFTSMTVPDTVQITSAAAASSSSIKLEWANVTGADIYTVHVEAFFSIDKFSQNFTSSYGEVTGLTSSTTYECYVIASNSAGSGVKGTGRTITTLIPPPPDVNVTSTGKSSARVTWTAATTPVLHYLVIVTDTDTSNAPVTHETDETSFDIIDLEPCSTYTVGVSSLDSFLMPGEPNERSYTTSNINAVSTFSQTYTCSSATSRVTWDTVFGANSYRATVTGGSGESLNCTSNSTSCDISMLKCGEKYTLQVTALSDDCSSTSSTTASFDTVPCAPANPTINYGCSNAIEFEWEETNNTIYYTAKATDSNNNPKECRTRKNKCHFTNMDCGKNYTFTVKAISRDCNSAETEPRVIKTKPCIPENIKTSSKCSFDSLVTTWDAAAGAESYTMFLQGNVDKNYNCTTPDTNCTVTGIGCGEHVNVWVSASNGACSTREVLGDVGATAPCAPTNVSVTNDCSPDSANVSWVSSKGVVLYMAIAVDSIGTEYTCVTIDTKCSFENNLACGETFTVKVIGTNFLCNSSDSESVSFTTASCPPTNVNAVKDCDLNEALITWDHDATGSYTADLTDSDSGQTFSCNTVNTKSCVVTSPPCGKTYAVTVTYDGGSCTSTSAAATLDSVPCQPENVEAHMMCNTGELNVTWTNPTAAPEYRTEITGGTPTHTVLCNSTGTQCVQSGLNCGSSYMVKVYSVNGSCSSLPSTAVSVHTMPCQPGGVSVHKACSPNNSSVSWALTAGAAEYVAVATAADGSMSTCESDQTSCSFPDLKCGQVYSVTVSGLNGTCEGPQSSGTSLSTEPCRPVNVTSQLDCLAGTAVVSWAPSVNAANYSVTATNIGSTVNCHGPATNCGLTSLNCNDQYVVTVTASDGMCTSAESVAFNQDPVPCAPQNVQASLNCNTNDITVSWDAVREDWEYNVTAVLLTGQAADATCTTTSDNCTLTGLQCGQNYSITVVPFFGTCIGPASSPVIKSTGPCGPTGLTTEITCGSNDLDVSLSAASGSSSYIVIVSGPNAFSTNCTVTSLSCQITGLQCATQFTVSAVSVEGDCSSSPTQKVVTTGPCDPANVRSTLNCCADSATVSWDAASGADAYRVKASEDGSPHVTSCTSTSGTTSCELQNLNCGQNYTLTVVSEDATCNSTGTTDSLTSAPCPPAYQSYSLICGTTNSSLTLTSVQSATGYSVSATAANAHSVSCTSTSASDCTLTGLQCSQDYTATAVAQGSECDSMPSSPFTIATTPCAPSITSTYYTCSSANISWTEPAGNTGFQAQVVGDHTASCDTISNSCEFQNIPCGLSLQVKVKAKGSQCDSDYGVSNTFDTAPCAPENVSATLICDNDSAMVTWEQSSFAVNYTVTATGLSSVKHCHNVSTSCMIQGLQCGEEYDIRVTPHSGECTGLTSPVHTFKSGLCAPTSAWLSPGCQFITVYWSDVEGAEKFVATATDGNGQTYTCESSTSKSCNFTNMPCGQNYSVSVVTVDRGCSSQPVSAGQLATVPCPPTSLSGNTDCSTKVTTLTWDQSSVPGTSYSVKVELIDSNPPTSVMHSAATNTFDLNLECGATYNLSVANEKDNCLSSYSAPIQISTEPCVPSNINVSVDCEAKIANVSWQTSKGPRSYVSHLRSSDHTDTCSSSSSSCQPSHLHCGEEYNVSVTAVGENCNATGHMATNFYTEPCEATGVTVSYTMGSALVQWTSAQGATSYSVEAVSDQGAPSVCSNFGATNCIVSGLQCSELYNVTVTAHNQVCDSQGVTSDTVQLITEPCPPSNIQSSVACEQLTATISWDPSVFAEGYIAFINDTQGNSDTCTAASTDTSCVMSNLVCDSVYGAWVVARGAQYNSSISQVISFTSAPCLPPSIDAQVDCSSDGAATLSWTASAGNNYSVFDGAQQSLCTTQQNSCTVSSLNCGQSYSLGLTVTNVQCTLTAEAQGIFTTRPCAPTGINTTHSCGSGNITIAWDSSDGADEYIATVTPGFGDSHSCTSQSSLSCIISGLPCGQNFAVVLTASNAQCNITSSASVFQATDPCPPTNGEAVMDCTTDTAIVSWSASDGGVEYTVTDQSNSVTCDSSGLTCNLTNVPCGTQYSLQVVAKDSQCSSLPSQNVALTTAPCPPLNVNANIDCANDLTISWTPSAHADYYLVSATAQNGGSNEACNITNSPCTASSVSCGNTFVAEVTAVRGSCHSSPSSTATALSVPCQPQGVSGVIDCVKNSARISWTSALGANSYIALALGDQNRRANCTTSTNTTCEIELECATHYNFTVTATNNQCESPASAHIELQTAPCSLTGIRAFTQCHNSTIHVEWDIAQGGSADTVYIATAEDSNNNNISCNSKGNSCYLQSAQCGQRYTIIVSATSDVCKDLRSSPYHITTEPCAPSAPTVVDSCVDAVVSWTPSPVADTYHVFATGKDGHQHNCNSTFNNCTLTPLHCDQQYSVHVIASHENCSSLASLSVTFNTGPCTPSNLQVTYYCTNFSALLTWNESSNAGSYHASAVDENGSMLCCSSLTPSCKFDGLQCGSTYNFTVLATDGTCNSSHSDQIVAGAVPCPPENVAIKQLPMQNNTQVQSVTWLASNCNNTETFVTLTGNLLGNPFTQVYITSYWTTAIFFELPLPCGTEYNATVKYRNSAGESNPSVSISGISVTCSP